MGGGAFSHWFLPPLAVQAGKQAPMASVMVLRKKTLSAFLGGPGCQLSWKRAWYCLQQLGLTLEVGQGGGMRALKRVCI